MLKLQEVLNIIQSKDGDELFLNVAEMFERMGIKVTDDYNVVKDLYTLCHEVVEVRNKEK